MKNLIIKVAKCVLSDAISNFNYLIAIIFVQNTVRITVCFNRIYGDKELCTLPCKPRCLVFHMDVSRVYMYDLKGGEEYFQHDLFEVNGTYVVKPPHVLTFLLDDLN